MLKNEKFETKIPNLFIIMIRKFVNFMSLKNLSRKIDKMYKT